MPVPLEKIDSLQPLVEVKLDPIAHVIKRKRATRALWIAMKDGKPIGCIYDTVDEVTRAQGPGTYNIQKLHPVGDIELIKKIRSMSTK